MFYLCIIYLLSYVFGNRILSNANTVLSTQCDRYQILCVGIKDHRINDDILDMYYPKFLLIISISFYGFFVYF